MKEVFRIFIKFLSYILTLIVGIALVLFVILPVLFNYKPYVVLSGSMEPSIRTGSVAWVDTKDKDVHVNDVVTYTLGEDTTVTHRIIGTEGNEYITKGDMNETEDLVNVSRDMLIGKFKFSIPYLGYIVATLQNRRYLIFFIFLICFSIVGLDVILSSSRKKLKRKKEKKKRGKGGKKNSHPENKDGNL